MQALVRLVNNKVVVQTSQPVYVPRTHFAGNQGVLESVPVSEVRVWLEGMLRFVHEKHQPLWQKITDSRDLDDAAASQLSDVLAAYQKEYTAAKDKTKAVKA